MDLYKLSRDLSCRGDAVNIWLDALLCRVPGCAVLIVATHGDQFGDNPGKVDAALSDLQNVIEKHMKDKRDELDRVADVMQTGQAAPSIRICDVVVASGHSTDDLSELRKKIYSLARSKTDDDTRLFRSVGTDVPVSWARVWLVMEALHKGADPFIAGGSIDQPVVPIEGSKRHEVVTWEHALETWRAVVSGLNLAKEIGGESPEKTEHVFKVRHRFASLRRLMGLVITSFDDSPCYHVFHLQMTTTFMDHCGIS